MRSRITILAALGLAAALAAGTASAGGIPTPDRGHGHGKHYSQGHGHGRGYRYERHYGHSYERRYGYRSSHGYHGGYGHHRNSSYYRGPARVVTYSRYEVHRHGPSCGHAGYSRGWTRSYSPYYYSRHRDYGRASFGGYDDGVRYYIEFDY